MLPIQFAQKHFGNLLLELWAVKVEIMTGLSHLHIATMRQEAFLPTNDQGGAANVLPLRPIVMRDLILR